MTNTDQIRVGLIGCGYQGQWLAKAVVGVENLILTGYVDPNTDAAAKVREISNGASSYPSPEALLNSDQVDAVLVATPHHLLQPYALLAIQANKHVLAEKPIALNASQARELEAAVAKQGVTFMSGYSFRYFDHPAQARQLLADGVIGNIQTISAGMIRPGLRSGWASDPAAGGGMLGFFGCHIVDRVLWFLEDEPVEVFAEVRYHPDSGVDLTSIFQVRFAGGATAQFNVCGEANGPFDFAHICGDAGYMYLAVENFPQYSLTVSSTIIEEYAASKIYRSDLGREAAILKKMVAELNDFARTIRRGCHSPITVEDGRKVLEILDAVIRSGKTGRPVAIGR